MVVSCIDCGGILEVMFIISGFGALLKWLRKRHQDKKCKCCDEHKEDKK